MVVKHFKIYKCKVKSKTFLQPVPVSLVAAENQMLICKSFYSYSSVFAILYYTSTALSILSGGTPARWRNCNFFVARALITNILSISDKFTVMSL